MRVLLASANPSLVRSPNLPLGYLAAAVERSGHEVRLVDICQAGENRTSIEEAIGAGPWDAIGFQVYSCGYDESRRLARLSRLLWPSAVVLMGGRHVSALAEEIVSEEEAVDFALVSECEETLPRLLDRLSNGARDTRDLPDLCYRTNGGVHRGPAGPLPDLDALPLPAWHHISPGLYPHAPPGGFVKALPVAPILTSRGCPYRCRFCAAGVVTGRSIRFRNPQAVAEEASFLARRYGVREIQIIDDNFTLRKEHALATCEALLSRGLRLFISLPNGVRLDRLDRELIETLERAGCYSLTVGIDSGSPRVLDRMERGITLDAMEERIRLVKDHSRIRVTGNFILGFPGETIQDMNETVRFAKRLPLDRAYFGFYLPLPGSPLFEELREAGRLEGLSYADLSPSAARIPFVPEGLTRSELGRVVQRAYLSFYGRPGVILGLAREVRGLRHVAFLARKVVGCLRRKKGSARCYAASVAASGTS